MKVHKRLDLFEKKIPLPLEKRKPITNVLDDEMPEGFIPHHASAAHNSTEDRSAFT